MAIKDKIGIRASYNNIGNIYQQQSNLSEALKYFILSVKLSEQDNDARMMAMTYHNIGLIYSSMKDYKTALEYLSKAKTLNTKIGNKKFLSYNIGEIGNVYLNLNRFEEAIKEFEVAIKITNEIGDPSGIMHNYVHLGEAYRLQGKNAEAIEQYTEALSYAERLGDLSAISSINAFLASSNEVTGQFDKALEHAKKTLTIAKEIKYLTGIVQGHELLTTIYSKMSNYKEAFKYSVLFKNSYDSLINLENTKKTLALQMQYEFDKKEAGIKLEQEKKNAIAIEEIQRQKLVRNAFIGGFAVVLLFAGLFFRQRNNIKKSKQRSDELLLNILPEEVADELKQVGESKAKNFDMVSVMFTDFKDFTKISARVNAQELVSELHACFSAFDNILMKYKIEKIKTIGDAYMCVSGLPAVNQFHALDTVKAAQDILEFMLNRKSEREAKNEFYFELRIGINTGPVVAGIVGIKKFSYDIWGDTLNLAARMEQHGEAGKINISETTYELVKNDFNCIERGKIAMKGKGEMEMYFVEK